MSRGIVCKLIDQVQTLLGNQKIIKLNGQEICIENKNNKLNFLENCIGKAGIYIFYKNQKPIYVGVGGIKATQDLKKRISQELLWYDTEKKKGDTGATLSKNMKNESQELFCKELQEMELKICAFDKNKKNQNLSVRLEHLLIGIYNPKYNRG